MGSAQKAVLQVAEFVEARRQLAQTTLRSFWGRRLCNHAMGVTRKLKIRAMRAVSTPVALSDIFFFQFSLYKP